MSPVVPTPLHHHHVHLSLLVTSLAFLPRLVTENVAECSLKRLPLQTELEVEAVEDLEASATDLRLLQLPLSSPSRAAAALASAAALSVADGHVPEDRAAAPDQVQGGRGVEAASVVADASAKEGAALIDLGGPDSGAGAESGPGSRERRQPKHQEDPYKQGHPAAAAGNWSGDPKEWNRALLWNEIPIGSWAWPQAALYQVLIDRFASSNEKPCERLNDYCGGDIQGLRNRLGYLFDLGIDGVVLSPVADQMPGGYHGQWTRDLDKINPRYGTEEELQELVLALHEQHIKVFAEVNLNHAGLPNMNVSDATTMADIKPFNLPEHYHSESCSLARDSDYTVDQYPLERCRVHGLLDYRHENYMVWQRLMHWVRDHVDRFGFDGLRIGSARYIFRNFLDHIPESGPPIPAFFDVAHSDMYYIARYATNDYSAIYNWPLYEVLTSIFVPGPDQRPMLQLEVWMKEQAPMVEGKLLLNFIDDADLPRLLYRIGETGLVPEEAVLSLHRNALTCILGMEGVPLLQYGSEQDMRGKPDDSDSMVSDGWRPPLWQEGYSTNGTTFQLIQKVLWLRRRLHGMHAFKQVPLFSDRRVFAWARGPAVFAVTNAWRVGPVAAERAVWEGPVGGPLTEPTWLCNLAAPNPRADCAWLTQGDLAGLKISGSPKVLVPVEIIDDWLMWSTAEAEAHRAARPASPAGPGLPSVAAAAAAAAAAGEEEEPLPVVLPALRWREMPDPPSLQVEMQERVPRARHPFDTALNSNPSLVWHYFPILPPHLDRWGPPVGVSVPHLIRGNLENSCYYLGPGEKDGVVVARRGSTFYVLCPDAEGECHKVINEQVDLRKVSSTLGKAMPPEDALPVAHLTFDIWYGVYHILVSALPSIMPYLHRLRSGSMRAFLHAGHQLAAPVLSMLGVSDSVFHPPHDPPLQESFHFCAPQIYFDCSTRPSYPRLEFSRQYLHDFRKAVAQADWPRPCDRRPPGHILVLSRGKSARALQNEAELVADLQTLGRPVEVLVAGPANFLETLQALARAEVLVGAHGANLANMIFAPRGMKVVEIVPQAPFLMQDYHFWDLSAALNYTYTPVGARVGPDEFDSNMSNTPMSANQAVRGYRVDVKQVTAAVAQMLA